MPAGITLSCRSLIVAVVATTLVTGCGGGTKPSSSAGARGTAGSTFTVKVDNQGAGGGAVTSTPAGISCAPETTCSADFAYGTTVVLTAGTTTLHFNGWFGDCSTTGTCTLTGNADKYVVAYFSLKPESHPNITDPKLHGPAFVNQTLTCTDCHGANYQGVGIIPSCNDCHAKNGHPNWLTDCTLCHGDATRTTPAGIAAAPPTDTHGLSSSAAVGAHQRHLVGGPFRGGVACSECHIVPTDMQHSQQPLDLTWGALARAGGTTPTFNPTALTCTNYCHGASLAGGALTAPAWDKGASQVACDSCHALPPPASSGHPDLGANLPLASCSHCHPSVLADGSIDLAGGLHMDGKPDVTITGSGCTACHGQPPATGSHMVHPIQCNDCHAATTSDGTTITNPALHMNRVADVVPGNGATFSYAFATGGSTCSNISCHFGGSATWGATVSNHVATLGAGDIVVFAVANTDHGDNFSIGESCTLCHYEDLKTQHAQRCDLCHEGSNPVGSLTGGWSKGCSQDACHPSVHTVSTGSDHFGMWANSSAACDRCHDSIGGFPGSGDNCSWCHAPAFTAGAVGDHAPPTTTSNAQASYTGATTIRVSATDAGSSGVSVTWTSLDGGRWNLSQNGSADVYVSAPASGSRAHTLYFYSVDHALNVETTKSASFTVQAVDTTPPTTTASPNPAVGAAFKVNPSITLTPSDAGSGVKATYYKIDAGAFVQGTTFTVSGDGLHTFSWYSVDNANNTETTHVSNQFRIDTVAPVTTCNAVSGTTYTGAQTFTLSASDTGGSGVASTWYRLDSGSFVSGSSVAVAAPASGSASHTISWYAIDVATNQEATKSVTFTVQASADAIPPVTTSSFNPAAGAAYKAQTVTLTPSDAGSGVKATYYKIDGGAFTQGTSFTISSDGLHTFSWYSVDNANNTETTHVSNSFRIDTIAPVTTSTAVNGTTYTGPQTFTLSASDTNGSGVASTRYSLDGAAFTVGTSIAVAAPASGSASHTIQWYSTDVAGNQETTHSVTFTVQAAPVAGQTVTLVGSNSSSSGHPYTHFWVNDATDTTLIGDGGWSSDEHVTGASFVVPAGVGYVMHVEWEYPDYEGGETGSDSRVITSAEAAAGATVTWALNLP